MKYKTVQTMMLPDSTEENHGLYYQGTEGVHVINEGKKSLYIPENEKAELFTYFNGFYPGQWSEYTELNGLHVEVTVSGAKKLLKVHLNEEVVDPDDIEMLEDLIVAAVNEAMEKADAESASAMSKFTGGMGGTMPGLF